MTLSKQDLKKVVGEEMWKSLMMDEKYDQITAPAVEKDGLVQELQKILHVLKTSTAVVDEVDWVSFVLQRSF